MAEQYEEYRFRGEDTYRLIVDLAEEGVLILDREDRIVFTNRKLQSMTGYSRDELLCHRVYKIVAGEDREIVKKALDRRHRGVKETYVARLRRKDASTFWAVIAAAPYMDEKGKYSGTVTMASDITQLKQAEEALREEKDLANMYLDLMAHDINNLIQVAIGNLEIAIDRAGPGKPADRELAGFLNKSLDTMYRCSRLIDNVKTLQRLKTEHVTPEAIDPGVMIDEALREHANVPGREVKVVFERAPGCRVRANRLLKEVFANLIGNSVKHSQGPVTIWIDVGRVKGKDAEYCRIAVADDGPGIPDEMKANLFQRYSRGETKAPGHGLGLYLVKALVEGFHGKVWAEDRVPGDHSKGSRFVVLLPAAQ
jgi:PAS domain S-box-containing protein